MPPAQQTGNNQPIWGIRRAKTQPTHKRGPILFITALIPFNILVCHQLQGLSGSNTNHVAISLTHTIAFLFLFLFRPPFGLPGTGFASACSSENQMPVIHKCNGPSDGRQHLWLSVMRRRSCKKDLALCIVEMSSSPSAGPLVLLVANCIVSMGGKQLQSSAYPFPAIRLFKGHMFIQHGYKEVMTHLACFE